MSDDAAAALLAQHILKAETSAYYSTAASLRLHHSRDDSFEA
jgi:hypothetical protein